MNIIIEDALNLKYLGNNGKWTTNADEGKNFTNSHLALEAGNKEPIGAFNIVRYFNLTQQMVNLDHGKGTGAVVV